MPHYSKNSLDKLQTTHPDIITIFQEVIKIFDNVIVYGYRSPAVQFELYKKGRSLINGKWSITDKSKVVTYKDGINEKSKHNFDPALAVDAIPSPANYEDKERMYYFAGFVMCLAIKLKEERRISHDIRWGGNWDSDFDLHDQTFMDLAHFELI